MVDIRLVVVVVAVHAVGVFMGLGERRGEACEAGEHGRQGWVGAGVRCRSSAALGWAQVRNGVCLLNHAQIKP